MPASMAAPRIAGKGRVLESRGISLRRGRSRAAERNDTMLLGHDRSRGDLCVVWNDSAAGHLRALRHPNCQTTDVVFMQPKDVYF
jgi:hypothetical protein